ncbi:tRNA (adenosine(37)-N6)-threonylcarbamoyltransferase complex transferase subunit TsaD [Eubacterium pyruvativorans]|uniref:tRNA (adenosine(37)-N6)-threonylcarbamoyltransferase complex transferase subunit TsaD n=1 Tax=Eubacterium pyruvativorans TaxID=155865 RepID=UPI000885072A|nr:tRNA (adenosine(37)-N6)-threonylcarbamoyltransferase complex transferase subunit TsaD [Eubacterium pyruvativorans]MCI5746235.1 tRNA (adenosine(37)-N6)-threonylcarbamoyltransferase complex transferase subunit TsaD [Eubacterium pyruvativorans]MDD6707085.1 tRNA (adenosine(37)-N6)-threonylcarbamoyltransferase complex transferase subunit TsaD [Eubacterium pyruvativorans]MDY4049610.1 tRNA (adenosine(37)-N6)-threonylcarbamoyltransferase complex transferase subunit TsaD [Eubacterium pyruvativorans]S
MKDGRFITMGIESSCDETSIALVADGRHILSDVISSQISIHTKFGGVVPEIASRHHLQNINRVMERALEEADITLDEVDLIGVTNGPGLIGALVIGVAAAKALSFARDIPLVGVNHMHGHVSANYLQYEDLEPPFMALIISGGHTNIVEVTDYNTCTVLGGTRDDAAGEAYDKVARVIGLGYPGGPKMDRAAREGNPDAIHFKRVYLEKGSYDFSFSGIKTQVLNYVNQERQKGREINVPDLAASFQQALLDVIIQKTIAAVQERGEKRVVMAGGVSANSHLREQMQAACDANGIRLYRPDPVLCTDNGAMIAAAAYYKYQKQGPDGLDLDAYANLPL